MKIKTNCIDIVKRIFNKRSTNPFYFICFVTSKCNMKCEHCFYWKNINKNKNELSFDEHQKVSENMGKIAFLSLTGGEPFLRKDLSQIAEIYCKNNGVRKLAIPTNGSLPSRITEEVKHILDTCKNVSVDIDLSIDGVREIHDRIRGCKDSFDKAIKTYNLLKELKKDYNQLGITIVSTFTALNQHNIMGLYKYIKENLTEAAFSINLVRGSPCHPELCKVNIKLYEEITNKLVEECIKKSRFNKNAPLSKISAEKNIIRYEIIKDTYKNRRFISYCYAAQLNGVMYEDGNVYCCELLNKKIGNVRDYNYDFKKLWQSKNAKEIIDFIHKTKCFCTHECIWTTNILFNPRFYPRLLLGSLRL